MKVVREVNHWKFVSKTVDFLHEKDGKPICKLSRRDAIRKTFHRLPVEEAVNRFKKDSRIRTGVRNSSGVNVHCCIENEILHEFSLVNKGLTVDGKLRKS